MTKEEILEAFAGLTAEDQAAIRERLALDPMAMCMAMMQKAQGRRDPMAGCKQMTERMRDHCACACK